MAKKYNADSITWLKGLEGVRARPGVYIGGNDSEGMLHCVKEVVGNSIDEATNGHCDTIGISYDNEYITVFDTGRGIPTGKHKMDKKRDTLTIIMTELHSGGKLKNTEANYTTAIGCFVGATKIKMLNGKSVRIDKLTESFEKTGKKRWVYAFNKESKQSFVPRKAYGVYATRMASELTEVILDNQQRVLCTPDHPFMLWDGKYKEAAKLKVGQSLRAVHFIEDSDGYLTHSGLTKLSTNAKQHMYRVNRTVAKGMGWNIEGKEVSHKNAKKQDNRPTNLQVFDTKEHWWYDHDTHEKNKDFTVKSKSFKRKASKRMHSLNAQIEDMQERAQEGRYSQIAARAYRDYGVVNEGTYTACRSWCGPKWDKAIAVFGSERNLLRAAKAYIRQYGKDGRSNNGGLGLNYKLQSEYEKSPADNINNHKVVSIRTFDTKKPIQVYGMSVEYDHNYLLDAGVFVKNTNGIGLAAVNALSVKMEVFTKHSGSWQMQSYAKGVPTSEVVKVAKVPSFQGKKWPEGTIVRFKPDTSVFEKGSKLKAKDIHEWVSRLSWFVSGPKKKKTDEAGTPISFKFDFNGKHFEIKRKGLAQYATYTAAKVLKSEPLVENLKPFVFVGKGVDVVLYPTKGATTSLYASVNSVETKGGGTHVLALRKVLTDAFASVSTRKHKYSIDDLMAGMVLCCNVRMINTQYDSQSKYRLTSKIVDQFDGLQAALTAWCKKNKSKVLLMLERATALSSQSIDAALMRKLTAALKTKKGGKSMLPPELIVSTGCKNRDDREIFFVEGQSAGGSAQKASSRRFQEILLLRGKVLNVLKAKSERMSDSRIIVAILKSLGFDPKQDYSKTRRIGSVFLLTDPDPDGPLQASTKVHLLDGSNPTIKEVHKRFENGEEMYVWGRKGEESLFPAKIEGVNKVRSDEALKVTLDDGTVLRMTPNHRCYVYDSKGNLKEKRARTLSVGNSLPAEYLIRRNTDGWGNKDYLGQGRLFSPGVDKIVEARGQVKERTIYGEPLTCDEMLHRKVMRLLKPKGYKKYQKQNGVGVRTDLINIHHKDENVSNNSPENLEFLGVGQHAGLHSSVTLTKFNKSKRHRLQVSKMNTNEDMKSKQMYGRLVAYAATLVRDFGILKITAKLWDEELSNYAGANPCKYKNLPVPLKQILKQVVAEDIQSVTPRLTLKAKNTRIKTSTTNRNKTWLANYEAELKSAGFENTRKGREDYNESLRLKGNRGLSEPTYQKFKAQFNHKIVKIEYEQLKQESFYCLQVPETNNFYIHDKKGNMLLTGNSHISSLLMGLLYTVVPDLFKEGRVFNVVAPLYVYTTATKKLFGSTLKEITTAAGKGFDSKNLTRLKGWGEAQPKELATFAFDRTTRVVQRISVENAIESKKSLEQMLGHGVEFRRTLLGLQD